MIGLGRRTGGLGLGLVLLWGCVTPPLERAPSTPVEATDESASPAVALAPEDPGAKTAPRASAPGAAVTAREPAGSAESNAAVARVSLERVVAVGASATAGFLLPNDLQPSLAALLAGPGESSARAPRVQGDALFFNHPVASARAQLRFVEEARATLVVALDFLFWFAYGSLDADGRPLRREEQRLELLEVGLDLLDSVRVPLVVSDLPDMSDAVGVMLMSSQVPAQETRARLNERIRDWAAARGDVLVLPLAALHEAMRSGDSFELHGYVWPAGSDRRLLQWDRLHPTQEGLAVLTYLAGAELVAAGWVRATDLETDLLALLETLGVSSPVRPVVSAE